MDSVKKLIALLKGFSKKKILFSGIAVVIVIALLPMLSAKWRRGMER